jgi:predicted DNA-binding transcriptional regulator YafY
MSKLSTERVTKIVQLIRQRGSVSMALLKEKLEVSEASIKRDFAFLRDRSNCPLEWDRDLHGYVIRDELAEGGRFELPGVWFDSSELFSLLTMLHLVDGVQPDLLGEHIGPLKTRLRKMLAAGTNSAIPIERKLKLVHFAPRKVETNHFKTVAGALLENRRLSLRYWNRDRKEETTRIVSPQQLVHYRENWILDAWCHTRDGLRSFALEAIRGAQVSDEIAIEVSKEEMDAHFRSGYGIFAGAAVHTAKLKFTPDRAQWISLETWHHQQTSRYLEDGSYVLEVPYSLDQELLMDILRYSPDVEVLDPPELRRKLESMLSAAAAKNS